jgi:hypothetical protein
LDGDLNFLIIFIATLSDLSCFTPKSSTPAPSQETLEWQSPQPMSAESSPLASALGLMQSSDQLRSEYGGTNTNGISSTWLPAYYLPLGGLNEVIYFRRAEIQNALQRIIYRLCSLALTHRSDIIAGQSSPVIGYLDQLLSLGSEDMSSAGEDRDLRTRDPIYLAMGRGDGASLMEQYLWKIYEMLRAAHGLILNKMPGEWEGFSNYTLLISILVQF